MSKSEVPTITQPPLPGLETAVGPTVWEMVASDVLKMQDGELKDGDGDSDLEGVYRYLLATAVHLKGRIRQEKRRG